MSYTQSLEVSKTALALPLKPIDLDPALTNGIDKTLL
jgi:hypothetical protein